MKEIYEILLNLIETDLVHDIDKRIKDLKKKWILEFFMEYWFGLGDKWDSQHDQIISQQIERWEKQLEEEK